MFNKIEIGKKNLTKPKNIRDFVDINFVQQIQDFLAKTLEVALVSVDGDTWLSEPSNNSDLCLKYLRKNPIGYKLCESCHRDWQKRAIETGRPVVCECHVGMTNFAIPISVSNRHYATLIGGQVRSRELDEKNLKKLAQELEICEEEFLNESRKIRFISDERLKATIDLLYLVVNSVAAVSLANLQLAELGIDYKMPRNIILEEWFLSKYGETKRTLTTREYQILRLIVDGKSNKEIAKDLFISVHTAKAHVSSILDKFEVEDRVQIAVKAVKEGFI